MNIVMNKSSEDMASSLVLLIQEKIGHRIIELEGYNLAYEQKKIKSLSSEIISFGDESSLSLEKVAGTNELVNILICVEDWLKVEESNWISIRWSIYDFEDVAKQKEEEMNHEVGLVYDRSKFNNALHLLEKKHDANSGVTWCDIDYYLEKYCRFSN